MKKLYFMLISVIICAFLFIACGHTNVSDSDSERIGSENSLCSECEIYVSTSSIASEYTVPFTSNRQSNFGIPDEWEINYEYLEEYLFNCPWTGWPNTPHDYNVVFGEDDISITMDWWEPHTGVAHWIRDIEVKDGVLIINTLRLDWGIGGAAMTFWRLSANVNKIYAPNVTEYKIVTRNVREAPKQLTVTIYEKYMDRVVDMDFVPQDFGPLVSEITWDRWDWGIERRLIIQYSGGGSADHIANTLFPQLEALPFVNSRPQIGFGLGFAVEIVVPIAPEYNDKFDREQFTLSDFRGITGIIAIGRYQHPNVRVNGQITLTLQEPGTINLNRLIYCVTNHNSYVETTDWIERYRIIYHYRIM